jgi:iron(III) transport system substrate-binding protein
LSRSHPRSRSRSSIPGLGVLGPLAALLAILTLPFVARPSHRAAADAGPGLGPASGSGSGRAETLVIITPHNEAIRHEFGRAFTRLMARRGRHVEIDWRSPGGGSEINRVLVAEYAASFEQYWTRTLGRRWSARVAAAAFGGGGADPRPRSGAKPGASAGAGAGAIEVEAAAARQAFLASNVGCGVDLLFGGGSVDADLHATAGRLVDAGLVRRHPELFGPGPGAIPAVLGGEVLWDPGGRWLGTCLAGFGICFNRDAIARLGLGGPPDSWSALADPAYLAELGLADPGKSGSAVKSFEMIIQEQMQGARRRAEARGIDAASLDAVAVREGWQAAMRLIRRLAGNARYFSDAATRVPIDVATGDAAAGMCIDFYGRFQSEVTDAAGAPGRMGFAMPKAGTSVGPDSIGMLRGAPHPAVAIEFMEFVLSEQGQKIWSFRKGAPGGPEDYSLQRLPIVPALYAPAYDGFRADPEMHPYSAAQDFVYHEAWTRPLFRAIAFVVRVMCVDPGPELQAAYRALAESHFPPQATALFDDVSAVDYDIVNGPLREALRSPNAIDEVTWTNRLIRRFRDQYRAVARLARSATAATPGAPSAAGPMGQVP